MNVEGAVFDLDGTLIDSLEDLADSMNEVLKHNRFPPHPVEAYRHFVGSGIRNLVQKALPATANEAVVCRCLEQMIAFYRENSLNKTKLYNGIPDLLDELASRQIRMAVLSNKADALTQNIAEGLLTRWNFHPVLGMVNEATRKPNPAGALQISRVWDIPPEKIIYLGDSGIDMQTACNAGMYPIGVLWGFRTAGELTANGAGQLLHHPSDLIPLIRRNG